MFSTDVYHSQDVPEVELVNLLEDQLPQYKLRVDSLYLYDHQDWIQHSPTQSNGLGSLSPVLAEETFRYMSKSHNSFIFLANHNLIHNVITACRMVSHVQNIFCWSCTICLLCCRAVQ